MNKNLGIYRQTEFLEEQIAKYSKLEGREKTKALEGLASSTERIPNGYYHNYSSSEATNADMKEISRRLRNCCRDLKAIPIDDNSENGIALNKAISWLEHMLEETEWWSNEGRYLKTEAEKATEKREKIAKYKKELAELEYKFNQITIPSLSGGVFQILGIAVIIAGFSATGIEVAILGLLCLLFGLYASSKKKSAIKNKEAYNNLILNKKNAILELEKSK